MNRTFTSPQQNVLKEHGRNVLDNLLASAIWVVIVASAGYISSLLGISCKVPLWAIVVSVICICIGVWWIIKGKKRIRNLEHRIAYLNAELQGIVMDVTKFTEETKNGKEKVQKDISKITGEVIDMISASGKMNEKLEHIEKNCNIVPKKYMPSEGELEILKLLAKDCSCSFYDLVQTVHLTKLEIEAYLENLKKNGYIEVKWADENAPVMLKQKGKMYLLSLGIKE